METDDTPEPTEDSDFDDEVPTNFPGHEILPSVSLKLQYLLYYVKIGVYCYFYASYT